MHAILHPARAVTLSFLAVIVLGALLLLSLLAFGWLFNEFANKPVITAIANLNTYNFLFIMTGALLVGVVLNYALAALIWFIVGQIIIKIIRR